MDKVLLKISLISLLNTIAGTALYPVIPAHIRSLGGSHFVLGLINSMFAGIQVFAGPVMGSWSDLKGRKFVATITLLISAVCCILVGAATSLKLLLVGKVFLATFEHTQILTKAMIGDFMPKEKLTEAYATSGAITTLGVIVGPVVAGHLVEVDNGFFYVCVLTALLHIANLGFVLTLKERRALQNSQLNLQSLASEVNKIFSDLKSINWKQFWEVFCVRFLLSFSTTIFFNQLIHISDKYDLSQKSIGYYIAFLGILSVLSVVALGWITKVFYTENGKQKTSTFTVHLFTLLTMSFFCLNIAPSYTSFLFATVPFAFTNTALMILSMEIIVEKSTDSDRGVLTGASESVLGIGRFLAPLVSGIMADLFQNTIVSSLPFIFSTLGIILSLKILKQDTVIYKTD